MNIFAKKFEELKFADYVARRVSSKNFTDDMASVVMDLDNGDCNVVLNCDVTKNTVITHDTIILIRDKLSIKTVHIDNNGKLDIEKLDRCYNMYLNVSTKYSNVMYDIFIDDETTQVYIMCKTIKDVKKDEHLYRTRKCEYLFEILHKFTYEKYLEQLNTNKFSNDTLHLPLSDMYDNFLTDLANYVIQKSNRTELFELYCTYLENQKNKSI